MLFLDQYKLMTGLQEVTLKNRLSKETKLTTQRGIYRPRSRPCGALGKNLMAPPRTYTVGTGKHFCHTILYIN